MPGTPLDSTPSEEQREELERADQNRSSLTEFEKRMASKIKHNELKLQARQRHQKKQDVRKQRAARSRSREAQQPQIASPSPKASNSKEAMESQELDSMVIPEQIDVDNEEQASQPAPEKDYSLPEWWSKINPNGPKMKNLLKKMSPKERQAYSALNALKDCLLRCENEPNSRTLAKYFDELREHVHKAEFLEGVNEHMLVKVHMLDNGLTRIFDPKGNVKFPWDLKADAAQLYTRWRSGDMSVELLRGILTAKGKDDNRSADRIDAAYRKKHSPSPYYYGAGALVMGQWWPTQLCTVRDGAHGSAQGGISGEKEKGAYSIILAGGGGYDDKDEGEQIWYCGTDGKDFKPTENTMRLVESRDKIKQPVRVIRSANLPQSNPYRPEHGYRFDGLYDVVSYSIVDSKKAIHRFRLVRCKGQDPIRYEKNKPSSRPTKWEQEAYQKEVVERSFSLSMSKTKK